MANFAAQLKDKFLGLVDRVTGCGRGVAGAGVGKDIGPEEPAAKLPNVQPIAIRPRDPDVNGGSTGGFN